MAPMLPIDVLQTARDLISIESITGNEEPVAAYLEGALRRLGLAVRSQVVAPGRRNLIAGPERPAVLFCTHMDTVPPYVPFREDAEHLHGRGACDTKGISAAMLGAGARLLERGFRDFGYLFVVGEETDNAGARAANEVVRAGCVVVGEPTESKAALGHKGVLRVRVKVHGTPCHSAYPEQGDSAIHRLVGALSKVLEADFGRSDRLGSATVNVGDISGGVAANVLAPSAEATVLVRVVTEAEDAWRRLLPCFLDPATGRPDPRVELAEEKRMEPAAFEGVEGYPETVVAYGTDAPSLKDVGRRVLFGPGSILDAHTDHERIAKRDVLAAVEQYADIALKLARRAGRG
ncbi:MAG: M20/M25/M40 family metallo-hydrolase [Planctomycetes bacterium]|nr:M20/M25/M40 family metallo-hydrolase [Planctomycetota bacterium]